MEIVRNPPVYLSPLIITGGFNPVTAAPPTTLFNHFLMVSSLDLGTDLFIDSVSVVPEPSAAVLMTMALTVLLITGLFRRKHEPVVRHLHSCRRQF